MARFDKKQDEGNKIIIDSGFQRGDETSGVWTINEKQLYVDSLVNGFPTLTLVKYPKCPSWFILDGANRIRTLISLINENLF